MTTSRLAVLLAILLSGLSTVFLLPKQIGYMPDGIELNLPDSLGEWWGEDMAVTQHERDVLGHDTRFARKQYTNGRGDRILVSVVLSGQDMMSSIHRPERCLRAQGWDFQEGKRRFLQVANRGKLPVMRLRNRKPERTIDGQSVMVEHVMYYWFAGSKDVTESHSSRVWIDMLDRIRSGYAQRWAMMSISSPITASHQKFGRDEKQTDELVAEFIRQLSPLLHKPEVRFVN
jgi:EpsI family protein